jgi:hypothetical protein
MNLNQFEFSEADLAASEAAASNPYLADPAKGLLLLTRLIADPPVQQDSGALQHLYRLHQLIHQGFLSLSARDDFPDGAAVYRDLLALEESLVYMLRFPDLVNKIGVGVGGGFSAGKSRFLNTLLGVSLLPEALEPTTAIPTFITGGEDAIVALNAFDHRVELDVDALQAISHAFHDHYRTVIGQEVGFAHLLKLLIIHRTGFGWRNLAFLDTPGYSKAENQHATNTDEHVALQQLAEADHLVWLLSAKNGCIQGNDLAFLRTLNHPRPIFFVVTQADLVGKNSINAILDSTRLAIEQAGLLSAGLMAWAAPLGAERGENVAGDDIAVWLCGLDAAPKFTNKRRRCAQQLDKHIAHNSNALTQNRALLMTLNELLPLADRSPERELVLTEKIQHLRTDQKRLLELVRQFGELKDEMLETITQIVGDQVLDEEVRRGRELVYTYKRDLLKRPINDGDIYLATVVEIRSDIKKLFIEVRDSGQQVVVLSVPFSKVRIDWHLDPMGFVKGSMLEAKVMAQDQESIIFAFTHQIKTN